MSIKHKFNSLIADGADETQVRPSNWNDDHDLITTLVAPDGADKILIKDTSDADNLKHIQITTLADLIAAVIAGSAPSTLDTLNELAAALGDDPNFAASVTAAIAAKVSKTGNETVAGVKTFSSSPVVPNPLALTDAANKQFVQALVAAVSPTGTSNITALVSGGQIILESGYTYRVSAAVYFIQGTQYSSAEQAITLNAADATNNRFDALALDASGAFVKITGTPSVNPSEPDIDPTTQLKLSLVLVQTGTTTPPEAVTETIYAENLEWTASVSGSGWVVNSTNLPHGGSKSIEATAAASNSYVQLARGLPETIGTFNSLSLFIFSKAAFGTGNVLRLQFYLSGVAKGTPITLASGYYGFDSSITTGYQLVVIPLTQFVLPPSTSFNGLRITSSGSGIGCFIDDITLQNSGTVGTSGPGGITLAQADVRYLQQTGYTDKPIPVDADTLLMFDSVESFWKTLTWANLKAAAKTHFDTLYVALTGDQTIDGVKTFSASPIVPAPTTNFQAATKQYVDAQFAGAGTGDMVKSTYDTNNNGKVDLAEDAEKLGGVAAANYATKTYAETYADALVVGLLDDRGNYNASGNVFPSTGGSGASGAILKGDLWTISAGGALGGNAVTAGDVVRALVDTPGQTSANWVITENNFGYAAENSANKSTNVNSDQASNTKYPSVKAAFDWATGLFALISRTITAGAGLTGGGNLSANRTISLADTSVTPGSYTNSNLTIDAQGRITAATNGTSGSSAPTQTSQSFTTANVASGVTNNQDIAVGKVAEVFKVSADKACRIRAYPTSAYRTADAARAIGTDPPNTIPLLLEAVLTSVSLSADAAQTAHLFNADGTVTNTIYFAVENRSGSAGTVTVTINKLVLEV